ncbi:glycosyltransferase family 4 protein [Heyndrickxia acidicola]|uniref:Glycosyltransferase family 4 protein n=1 Tax=Heyndrickxia acidicola TaxID=209389 RepID=A0ABU6MLC5_9BACI|nr:glycosyltransferase family 4 protein [Heyndrickxia acidicola]MED1205192.1 glycosyltransferase family 4 protein [Heyndrickxia acidicola]
MKRVLFTATVDLHFKAFHLPYLKWFKDQGWEVHVAACGEMELPFVDKKYHIPIERSPLSKNNVKAYKELKGIIEKNQYQIIHCHTPMGGVITRLAARQNRKLGTKILYTAHGFHFSKGAPLKNWFIYYPIEIYLSSFTDCLITINKEDYELAKKHPFTACQIKHVHGVGVDTRIYRPAERNEKELLRSEYGYKPHDFLMIYTAEFNKNKNQQLLIKLMGQIKRDIPHVKLLLAGHGPLVETCKNLAAELGLQHHIDFLGYRNDVEKLLKMSDAALGSSFREGLPVNIMEAMSCGLPVIASENRGHNELIQNGINGWTVKQKDLVNFAEKIKLLYDHEELRMQFGKNGRKRILNKYAVDKVLVEQSLIYDQYWKEWGEFQWAAH